MVQGIKSSINLYRKMIAVDHYRKIKAGKT